MSERRTDRLVRDYLKAVDAASAALPRAARRELHAQIEEHIRVACSGEPTEAEVRALLERLGEPEEIVAGEYGPQRPSRGIGAQAVSAIVLLLIGGFLAGIGWVAGVVLLWTSPAWTAREKLVGTLLVPGGLATSLYLTAAVGIEACSTSATTLSNGKTVGHAVTRCTGATTTLDQVLVAVLFALLILAPLASAVFLARAARRRLA